MRLYEGDPYNGLERLQRASQNFYDDVLEVEAIWGAQGPIYDHIRSCIVRAIENCIISTADADAITKYERYLNIWYEDGLPDLAFRRAMVAAAFIGTRHIGRPEILELLSLFTEREGKVGFDAGVVDVLVDGYLSDELAFYNMLLKKLPAHLGLRVTVAIRREIRWKRPFAWAGATGGMLEGEPAQRRREGINNLGAVNGLRITGRATGAYPDTQRTVSATLATGTGGMVFAEQQTEPVSREHQGAMEFAQLARTEVSGAIRADLANGPPKIERTTHAAGMGGAVYSPHGTADIAPPEPHSKRSKTPSKSGVFLRTHTTGRPVRRDDDA